MVSIRWGSTKVHSKVLVLMVVAGEVGSSVGVL